MWSFLCSGGGGWGDGGGGGVLWLKRMDGGKKVCNTFAEGHITFWRFFGVGVVGSGCLVLGGWLFVFRGS